MMNSSLSLRNVSDKEQPVHYNVSGWKFKDPSTVGRIKMGIGWNVSTPHWVHHDDEDYFVFDDSRVRTALFILYTIVFIFCFFGNLTVVLVMRLHWRMRSVTKFCLGNLAFANLCVGVFCIYQNLSLYLMDSWFFGTVLCKMYHFTNSLSHTASVLILVVISVERYFAILHPFKCRRILTIQRLRVIILAVWISSALLCSPRLYYIVTINNVLLGPKGEAPKYEIICSIGSSLFDSQTADMMQFLLLFALPLIIITILYTKIAFFLRERQAFPASFPRFSCSDGRSRTDEPNSDTSLSISQETASSVGGLRKMSVMGRKSKTFFKSSKSNNNKEQTLKRVLTRQRASVPSCSNNSQDSAIIQQKCTCTLTNAISEDVKTETSESACNKIISEKGKSARKAFVEMGNNSKGPSRLHQIQIKFTGTRSQRNSFGLFCYRGSVTALPCRHRGVIRMLILIVVTFAICNLPFHLRKIYQHYLHTPAYDSIWTELSTPFTFLLMYVNCAINPFLYAFMSQSFRACVADFFKCQLRKPTFL